MSGDAKRPAPGEQPYVLQQTKALTVGMAVEVDMALPLQGITVVAEQSSLGAVLPAIKLDAVLTFEGATDDGQLIQAVGAPWLRILELIERDPDEVYRIDPRQWEEIIAGAYKEDGFDEVTLTPRSGDLGRTSSRPARACSRFGSLTK
jgi:hypothetical protein